MIPLYPNDDYSHHEYGYRQLRMTTIFIMVNLESVVKLELGIVRDNGHVHVASGYKHSWTLSDKLNIFYMCSLSFSMHSFLLLERYYC